MNTVLKLDTQLAPEHKKAVQEKINTVNYPYYTPGDRMEILWRNTHLGVSEIIVTSCSNQFGPKLAEMLRDYAILHKQNIRFHASRCIAVEIAVPPGTTVGQ